MYIHLPTCLKYCSYGRPYLPTVVDVETTPFLPIILPKWTPHYLNAYESGSIDISL